MPTKINKTKRGGRPKFRPIMLVTIYRMLRAGLMEADIAKDLDITPRLLSMWKKSRSDVLQTMEIAYKDSGDGETFPAWVYSRLSPDLKELWDKIEAFSESPDSNGVNQIEAILLDQGRRVRQQLFLHALCVCSFSPSKALSKVNVTKKELDNWIENDPGFAELIEEMDWHKGNFFEESLVKLVKDLNPSAVMFANRNFNAERGYGNRSRVDLNVNGTILHGVLDLSELIPYISEECKLQLLDGIRKLEAEKKKQTNLPPTVTEVLTQQIASVPAETEDIPA